MMFASQIAMFVIYPICENIDVKEREDGTGSHTTAKAFRPFSVIPVNIIDWDSDFFPALSLGLSFALSTAIF